MQKIHVSFKLAYIDHLIVYLFNLFATRHFWMYSLSLALLLDVVLSFFSNMPFYGYMIVSLVLVFLFYFVRLIFLMQQSNASQSEWGWEMDKENLRIKLDTQYKDIPLNEMKKLVNMRNYFVLFPTEATYYVLPKRHLTTDEARFVGTVFSNVRQQRN